MRQNTRFVAEILEKSAAAYAGYAAGVLLEKHPEVEQRYGPSAMGYWKSHLTQRVLELAAALGAEEPRLFGARVQWARKAFRARDLDEQDLRASIACLGEVLKDELPEQAQGEVANYLDPALEALEDPFVAPSQELGLDPESDRGRLALSYLQAVLEGDSRQAIELVVAAAEGGTSVRELYLDVLVPAQREVGELWHMGEVGVAEEHHVTATTERAMAVLAQRVPRRPPVGKTMIAAAVAGNTHGLGVRVLADFFELAGWRSVCLGADVPPAEVATAAVYFDADLAVLSAALAVQLKTAGRTVDALRALEGREVKILVGGVAFADTSDLWRRLGADGHAPTADVAVELGGQLVGLAAD